MNGSKRKVCKRNRNEGFFLVVTRAVLEYYWAQDEIKKCPPNARESKGYIHYKKFQVH